MRVAIVSFAAALALLGCGPAPKCLRSHTEVIPASYRWDCGPHYSFGNGYKFTCGMGLHQQRNQWVCDEWEPRQ